MSEKPIANKPELNEIIDDNARKFVTEPIDSQFLSEHTALSYILIADWLKIGNDDEIKLVCKYFDNGDIQRLQIAKVTKDGDRKTEKAEITKQQYDERLPLATLHVEKRRHEFEFVQNGIPFSVKYDEFADDKLFMLEVDADDEDKRASFNPNDFPYTVTEVTGDIRYYGYRVAAILQA